MSFVLFALAGCGNREPERAAPAKTQPGIELTLIVHVDPLSRGVPSPCTNPELLACGRLDGETYLGRVDNLAWLAETWATPGRTLDLQVGPEMALAWMEDPIATASLATSLDPKAGDPSLRLGLAAELARDSVASLLATGTADLGVHVHGVLPDAEGTWGNAAWEKAAVHPCDAWADSPMVSRGAAIEEEIVSYGVRSVAPLAEAMGVDLTTFTGHIPTALSDKALVVSDPDAIDPDTERTFSPRFRPTGMGSAYAECLTQAVDHQPFERYPTDGIRALGSGTGPWVTPGQRVVGSMAEHLGEPSDGSLGAAGRVVVQLLLNWRFAGIEGADPRPWAFTFHEHLFDLFPGTPDPKRPEDRDPPSSIGGMFREDLQGLSTLVDELTSTQEWQGVGAEDGQAIARWVRPSELEPVGDFVSSFDYGGPDREPPQDFEADAYPYLRLVATALRDAHLTCRGSLEGIDVFGFLRCEAGFGWGAPSPGFSCLDGAPATEVHVLVPDATVCLADVPPEARGAAIDAVEMGPLASCSEGVEVPLQGLIVEAFDPTWLDEVCAPWPAP